MKKTILLAGLCACLPATAYAQTPASTEAGAPIVAQPRIAITATGSMLPADTPLIVTMNEELSTRKNKEGDTFYMSVASDVLVGDYVAIPKGARAIGTVQWLTGKGAFGKSGKMEISVEAVEVGGRRVPLVGVFRQEGEGNTVATVAAVALVWVAAPFITGKSGVIPRGRELTVHTKEDLPVQFAAAPATGPAPVSATGPVLASSPR